jgi:D-arabinose 5-phosphate isomerase GutQ
MLLPPNQARVYGKRKDLKLNNQEVTIMNKHMKIVVIGGSGLIGKKLVNNLRQHGQEVVAASLLLASTP